MAKDDGTGPANSYLPHGFCATSSACSISAIAWVKYPGLSDSPFASTNSIKDSI